jgi:hypothetical protein
MESEAWKSIQSRVANQLPRSESSRSIQPRVANQLPSSPFLQSEAWKSIQSRARESNMVMKPRLQLDLNLPPPQSLPDRKRLVPNRVSDEIDEITQQFPRRVPRAVVVPTALRLTRKERMKRVSKTPEPVAVPGPAGRSKRIRRPKVMQ